MAIVNTLKKCLDSPYLFEDPEAPARVEPLLAQAADRLEAARALHQGGVPGDQADASLLGYEAMFACVRALVYARGYREAGLRCLLLACDAFYVRTSQLDPDLLVAFERAQGLRAEPAAILQAAAALLERARTLLAQPGVPSAPATAVTS